MIRIGTVTQVYPEDCTVRVEYRDRDGQVSGKLKVLQHNTLKNQTYYLPDPGELVAVLFLNQSLGFVLGSFYSGNVPVPEDLQNKDRQGIFFADGSRILYDREKKKLTLDIRGDADTAVEKDFTLTVKGDTVLELTGDAVLSCEGDITVVAGTDKKILLGSGEAAEPAVLGNEYKKVYDILIEKVKNHTHEVPQSPSGTTTSAVSTTLADLKSLPDETLSGTVLTL